MSNPFIEPDHKSIPRDLDECRLIDRTSRELWKISSLVETWGVIILIAILILGTIFTVGAVVLMSDLVEGSGFATFICSAAIWGISGFIVYVFYHLISLAVRALAAIVQNTTISANVSLYEANKKTKIAAPSKPSFIHNTNDTPSPSAEKEGIADAEIVEKAPVSPSNPHDGEIICPGCGTKQRADRTVCWNCNQKFIK